MPSFISSPVGIHVFNCVVWYVWIQYLFTRLSDWEEQIDEKKVYEFLVSAKLQNGLNCMPESPFKGAGQT